MMKIIYILTAALAVMLTACGGKNANENELPGNAILEIPERVDMGEFEGPYYKKFVNIEFKNAGTDTLYIFSALPECECTEIEIVDSVVVPNGSGVIKAYLDLSGYIEVENEKIFSIKSNSKKARFTNITLFGRKK